MPSVDLRQKNSRTRSFLINIRACPEKWVKQLGDVADVDLYIGGAKSGRKVNKITQQRVEAILFAQNLCKVALEFCQEDVAQTSFEQATMPKGLLDKAVGWNKNRGKRLAANNGRKRPYRVWMDPQRRQKPTRTNIYSFTLTPQANVKIDVTPMNKECFLSRQFGGEESGEFFLRSVKDYARKVIVSFAYIQTKEARKAYAKSMQNLRSEWEIDMVAARKGQYGAHLKPLGLLLDQLQNHTMLYAGTPERQRQDFLPGDDVDQRDRPDVAI